MSARFIPVEPFDLVVFGGTGDLAMRKLLPGLYHRDLADQLPEQARIVGVSRKEMTKKAYAAQVEEAIRAHVEKDEIEAGVMRRFLQRLEHVALDAGREIDGEAASRGGWKKLAGLLAQEGAGDGNGDGDGAGRVRVFYLATAPRLFGPIAGNLGAAGLVTPASRVVLEKPIGRDLASAQAINEAVGAVFAEQQIFRIDHYLGKETVQNLIALRFANVFFEPLWNRAHIDHVQITVAESLGVEGRGGYYDRSGALRDMVQNHILQLLCLVAMEVPSSLEADALRDEKLKVLRSLEPIGRNEIEGRTVRGQYKAGAVDGKAVPGYQDELDAENGAEKGAEKAGEGRSTTETFVVLKAEIPNWRWAGVPFYLRTGKRMAGRQSEIVVQFRQVPHSIFAGQEAAGGRSIGEPPEGQAVRLTANRLVLRLQPDEAVRLFLMTKEPGPGGMRLRNVPLNLAFAETFEARYPDAYERLLMDVVRGNATLFMRKDEVEAAWRWIEPILEAWAASSEPPRGYTAGSWGPSAAIALIERDGRNWHEDAS
ncbi:MAG: glucose-6-phosphate dehydrogenase [Geminicoccaceae bacterium]|nr:glucose-6-phosphate dehydrogenase [Geminicoccaceae bacterium]